MSKFGELKQKTDNWSVEEEDILLRKLKTFSDCYLKKCEDLDTNLNNINKNINLIEFEYFNVSNKMKNISKIRFMEHIIDNAAIAVENPTTSQTPNNISNNKSQSNQIITREERETSLFSNYKRAFSKTLENLNANRSENNRDNNNDNLSMIEDDNLSVSSSKILSVGNKTYKNSKLPMTYGTKEFNSSKYLGLVDETNQSLVNNSNNSTTNIQNLNNNNNNLALSDNLNSRSQSNVYNNANNNPSSNPINPAQIQNNLNANNNNNYYRNYDQNYDYNSRPSMVSELTRPNFQQLMDQEISLGLNKKTSMEFNLLNNNNNVNFMRNQSLLIPNTNPTGGLIVNFAQAGATSTNQQTSNPKNMKPINIKGKAPPKAPPLPAFIQQALRKIPIPKVLPQNAIKSQNISVKLSQNLNSNMLRNPNLDENRNANFPLVKNEQSDDSGLLAQENNSKPLSFKENLSMKIGGLGGRPLAMPPKISMMENDSLDRINDVNENNFNKNNDLNQNYQNNYIASKNDPISFKNNEMRNPAANNNTIINNKSQLFPNNTFEKQKSVNLGNFVRKTSLFQVEEDEEEDNTGLFRRGTSNNINITLNKRNTQTNFDNPEEISNKFTSNTIEPKEDNNYSKFNSNNPPNSYNNDNDFQNKDSKKNLFSDENTNNIQNKQPISSQRSILKTKGLEKAKSNLNSMFAEEDENRVNFNEEEETAISINKKSVDITKRLSNIFNLDEDDDIPILSNKPAVKIPEQKNNRPVENNRFDKLKPNETKNEPNTKNLIQPIDNKIKETKILNSSSNENNFNQLNTKVPEPFKEEKSNIKPDLNKLNKLFLAEEEDELDFKNINFKKEEKKILNPQAKDLPKSSDIVKNIENLTNQKNEKAIVKKQFIIEDEDKLTEDKTIINEAGNENNNNKKNNNNSTINHHDSSNRTNTSSQNQSKNKLASVDPLTGEPLPIKKESAVKKNSIKTLSDPLSMIKSSVQKKNKNDQLSSIPSKNIITEDKKDISTTGEKPENQDSAKKDTEEKLLIEKKEGESKPAGRVSDLSKIMSAKMIFPGFPPQKKKEDNEFRPETLMNMGKIENSYIRKNSNLSEDENEKLNKIILDRPVVKNKKKQKLRKMVLEESSVNRSNEKLANENSIPFNELNVENESLIEKETIEEKQTENNIVIEKNPIPQISEIKINQIQEEPIMTKPQEEIKTSDEPNFKLSFENERNKIDLVPKKEDLFDPLSIMSKKSNSSVPVKSEINNPTPQSKIKKFNIFDDEDDKPKKDKADELFKLPQKRNTKIISFLDDNEGDDPLTALKKNKTIATKEEKTTKKKDMSDKLKFLLDD